MLNNDAKIARNIFHQNILKTIIFPWSEIIFTQDFNKMPIIEQMHINIKESASFEPELHPSLSSQ